MIKEYSGSSPTGEIEMSRTGPASIDPLEWDEIVRVRAKGEEDYIAVIVKEEVKKTAIVYGFRKDFGGKSKTAGYCIAPGSLSLDFWEAVGERVYYVADELDLAEEVAYQVVRKLPKLKL